MTPTQGSCICPICLNPFLALSYHLKRSHYIANIDERKILLNLATGRVNIRRAKCPVLGCAYQSSRLDKHLFDGHPELNSEELAIESDAVKKAVSLQLLSDLRASDPRVSMTSMLDIVDDEDEQQGVDNLEEEEEVVCQNQQCIQDRKSLEKLQRSIAQKDRESVLSLKKSQILAKKLRRCQQVIKEMKKGNATSWGEVEKKLEKEVDVDAEVEADQAEVDEVDQAEVVNEAEKQVEEVAMPSGQSSATTKDGQQEMERKTVFKGTGRGARMRHLSLPKNIEIFLEEYQLFHEGSEPNIKQKENAMSKTSRVRSFLFYLSVGRKDLSNWLFLDNTHGIRSYVTHLRQEGKEVTTVNFYLRNVYQFLTFLQQTPPKLCRLGRTQMTGLIRTVQNIIKNLAKPIVSHQLWVKATKMNRILSKVSLRLCQERARKVIPELLVQMEAGDYNLRDDFYGYFSAFVASIYGHRPGVLTNMKVGEVEAAKAEKLLDTDEGYVITVDEHKTSRFFGGAQIFLTFDEFLWLERWMAIRARMDPKTQYVLITKGDGPVKNLVRYMQTAWAHMGLPGRPTFTDIRTAVSGHAKNFHHPETRKKLATFMCHNTSTADRFYALVLDRSQAKELRGQFEAVTASSSSHAAGPVSTSAAPTSVAHRKSKKVVANSDNSEDSEDSTAISYQESGSSILEEEVVMEEEAREMEEASEKESKKEALICTPKRKKQRRMVVMVSPLKMALAKSRLSLVRKKKRA